MYWAVAHLLYNDDVFSSTYFTDNQDGKIYSRVDIGDHDSFRRSCSIAAVIFLIIIIIYSIVRFIFNKIGGLYMFKRMIFAVILAGSTFEHYVQEVDG